MSPRSNIKRSKLRQRFQVKDGERLMRDLMVMEEEKMENLARSRFKSDKLRNLKIYSLLLINMSLCIKIYHKIEIYLLYCIFYFYYILLGYNKL